MLKTVTRWCDRNYHVAINITRAKPCLSDGEDVKVIVQYILQNHSDFVLHWSGIDQAKEKLRPFQTSGGHRSDAVSLVDTSAEVTLKEL